MYCCMIKGGISPCCKPMLHRKPFRVTQQSPPGAGSRGNVSDNADIPAKIAALIKAASDKQHNNRTTEDGRRVGYRHQCCAAFPL